jgi:site-specific DNA-methyltransferase (adenine-specific)
MEIRSCDCLAEMQQMESETIDVVVTSPPYNLGISYRSYSDQLNREDYLRWCESWAGEIRRLLKADGAMFLNLGAAHTDPTLPLEVVLRLTRLFKLQNTIQWVKSISIERGDGSTFTAGHFKPLNSRRYLNNCHESIYHFTKDGNVAIDRLAVGVPYADKSNIKRWHHTGGRDRRCGGNVWFMPYETIRNRSMQRPHPATFPVELAERCIRLHGKADATVMDPFLGLGATAEAAQRLRVRRFIGFEIDREYADYAAQRIALSLQDKG